MLDAAVVPEAVWVAAEAPLQAAELPDVAAAQQREVLDAEAGQRPAARDAAAGRPEAPGGPGVELPSAAASAFHRDQVLPWPEP